MPVIVYDELPLTLYTLTPAREPLAFNTAGEFDGHEVALGLRVRNAGETTFDFTDPETFGHRVWLTDRQLNNTIELTGTNPKYTFTTAQTGEINDRFTLKMQYTGTGITVEAEQIEQRALQVSSGDRYIYVRSHEAISSLQVYSLTGALIYSTTAPSEQYRIAVSGQQTYIVKAKIGDEYKTEKVTVK
jgi:hypothetical protein